MSPLTAKQDRTSREATNKPTGAARWLRVFRQLVFGAVVGAAFYFLTTTLLDRFGRLGFLISLGILAVIMAVSAEFGSDIAAIPRRILASRKRTPAPRPSAATKNATLKKDAPPVPPPVEAATRDEAESLFRQQSERLKGGEISRDAFGQFTGTFYFIDPQGKFWTIQPDTERWAFYKEGQWRPGIPLGSLSKARLPSA